MSHRPPPLAAAWTMAGVAGGFLLLLLISLLLVVRVPVPNGTVRFCYGTIDYFSPPTTPRGFSITFSPGLPMLIPNWGTVRGGPFFVLPLWLPAALFGAFGRSMLRRAYAIPEGHCKKCRYNLEGNVSGVCPECGTAVAVA